MPENPGGDQLVLPFSTGTDFGFKISPRCPGDFNNDSVVGTADLTLLLVHFGQSGQACNVADMFADAVINTQDLTLFLLNFGRTCTAATTSPGGLGQDHVLGSSWQGLAQAPAAGDEGGQPSNGVQSGGDQATGTMTPPGAVIAALGFQTAETYDAYIATLNDQEFAAHLVRVLQVIKDLGLE